MKYQENGEKYKDYCEWESVHQRSYNYEKYGLLKHIISHKIIETQNNILKMVLLNFEKSLIFLMKYVDRLKHFKNYHWKNR